jgi:hypothetical protein
VLLDWKKKVQNEFDSIKFKVEKNLLSRKLQMNGKKQKAQANANYSDNQIRDAKKRILATNPCGCTYNKCFSTIETCYRIILTNSKYFTKKLQKKALKKQKLTVIDSNRIITGWQSVGKLI